MYVPPRGGLWSRDAKTRRRCRSGKTFVTPCCRCYISMWASRQASRGHLPDASLLWAQRDIPTSSQGSTRAILAIRASQNPLGPKHGILVSL